MAYTAEANVPGETDDARNDREVVLVSIIILKQYQILATQPPRIWEVSAVADGEMHSLVHRNP